VLKKKERNKNKGVKEGKMFVKRDCSVGEKLYNI
jgi:hypothetical protein